METRQTNSSIGPELIWDPFIFLNLTNSTFNLESEVTPRRLLSTRLELILVLLYTGLGIVGLLSNIALIFAIVGELTLHTVTSLGKTIFQSSSLKSSSTLTFIVYLNYHRT